MPNTVWSERTTEFWHEGELWTYDLKDVPGQLVGALEPISANDGNIKSVVHHHDVKVGGRIAVNVTFEVRSEQAMDKILSTWKQREVDIAKIDAFFETYPIQYLIVGNISSKEIESITKGLESMENIASIEIRCHPARPTPAPARPW